MDEVDAAFILPSNSQQSYKRWSSSVAPVPDFTMGFDSVIKGFEDVARGFDEVDASLPPVSDVWNRRELETVKLTEERASTGDSWALVGPAELALQLRAGLDRYLLIDSRSFLEYNTSNIQQSVNVCCSKIVKRRLQRDKVLIKDLLTQTCHVDIDDYEDVIVYDQCTENPGNLTDDTFLCVLLKKLTVAFKSVMLLKGGFLAFQAMYPSLCESKTNNYRCAALTSLSQPCLPVSNVGPTRILPFLYLGSQQDALSQDVTQVNDISYILNVSTACIKPPHISDGHFLRIPVNDSYSAKLQPYFNEAFQFLDKVREANGCVLVHCLAGISRSPTLAIAYIMRHLNMTSDEAYRYVKDKRPTISPNFNFLGQLLEFEKELKREKELNNNSPISAAQKSEARTWSNYVMDLSSHSPSSPVTKNLRPFVFETCGSQGLTSASVSHVVSNNKPGASEQKSTEKFLGTEQTTSDRLVLQTDCPFPSSTDVMEHQSETKNSSKVVKDVLSFTFPPDSTRTKLHPCTLNFDTSKRSPFSFPSEMTSSKSLTQISEVTECETPSPLALPSGDSTISTSYVQYQSKSTETFKPIFPCGENSTIVKDSSGMEVDQSYSSSFQRTVKNSSDHFVTSTEQTEIERTGTIGALRKSQSCMSRISDTSTSLDLSRYKQPYCVDSPVIPRVKSTPSPFTKFGGNKPLRTSLSLSLSPIVPLKPTSNSGENKTSSLKLKNVSVENKTEIDIHENVEQNESGKNDLRTNQLLNIPLYSNKSSVTMSQKVTLKSFGVTSRSLTLGAHSPTTPTASLAKLNFSVTEKDKHRKKYETKVETFVNEHPPMTETGEQNNAKSGPDRPPRFYSFPSTSLDKLNFTPCFSKMSEKDLRNEQNNIHTSPPRTSGVKRPLNNNLIDLQDEDVTSPMSVSSITSTSSSGSYTSGSVPSPVGHGIPAKLAVRKRERKPNRTNVRPNSIAFSKYPTFDLGSDCQDSPNSSGSGTSQDDASDMYIQNGKKSKPSDGIPDIRFRLGRYCEREVYMQITAAMESAMMKSQAFEATRKSRSLDDILSSEDDSSSPNCECSHFDRVLRHCALTRDRYSAPAALFESLACRRGSSDPYNSNSSLSSGGSRTSLHGSRELIQVS